MPQDFKTPRLQDVAKRAGVSTATVSRCLNDPDKVVEATRLRVLEAVRALGYSPNFGARAMAAKRTNTVGAVIPTMENAIFARGLQACQEALRTRGYQLLVASSSYSPEIEEEQIRALVARGAEALLLIGHDRTAVTKAFLKQRGLPVLVAWSFDGKAAFPSVGFDNRAAMKSMAERVLEFGHVNIGALSVSPLGNDRARERVMGIRDALSGRGLDADALPVVETSFGIDAGGEGFAELLRRAPQTTAVLCGNDVLAVGALREAARQGLAVPGDVSITGFDDIEIASVVTPELTTVHVPHRDMGQAAGHLMVQMVEEGEPSQSILLSTYVQERETLGRVAV